MLLAALLFEALMIGENADITAYTWKLTKGQEKIKMDCLPQNVICHVAEVH